MDLICPRCGEPWDMDTLHEEAQSRYIIPWGTEGYDEKEYGKVYQKVAAEFRVKGCLALTDFCITEADCPRRHNMRTDAAAMMYDLLGDDMDGAASMLDDAEYLGFLED